MAEVEPILVAGSGCPEMNQFPADTAAACFSSSLAFSLFDDSSKNLQGTANGLKRKRPLKIEIPNVLREISMDAFKGKIESENDGAICCFTGSNSGVGFGVCSLKGKKKFMEDAHKIFSSSNGDKVFFGVYDGHGGGKAAEFVADNLHLNIFEMLGKGESKEEGVKIGYLKTDEEFLKQGWGSGACCVTAVIWEREMMVSNLGDCRAVVCRRDGVAETLTADHRPSREAERSRIQQNGGYVEFHRGMWRVHGTLAVSRGIGDAHLKDWVVAEPDTRILHLTPEVQFLVLASDGLWDEVGNQEAVDIVIKQIQSQSQWNIGSSSRKYCSLVKSERRIFHPKGRSSKLCQKINKPCRESPNKQEEDDDDDEPSCSSPPHKTRRTSEAKKLKTMMMRKTSRNENQKPAVVNGGGHGLLGAACKELVDLAVSRGSLDDITVMIVDLAAATATPS
ncbi:probable protein phosphatase 2C 14 [Andrographis paniculata]|uniref:probable protein phosphatase 2C 14 n=1 Tax=Andrographis paniculata TaxID=175694 RepID=UPI0021E79E01|nr:probable protein phosphatase 2C 14 [Andrographis paniculata]